MKEINEAEAVRLYGLYGSIRQTAIELGASASRIRKVLIDCGAYETPQTRKAAELRSQGFTLPEIAEILHVCPKTVSAYLPYEKGAYGKAEASKNALKLRAWREKRGEK